MGELFLDRDAAIDLESGLSPLATKSSAQATKRNYALAEMVQQGSARLPFEYDRDRILHCRLFRRLSGKAQVLIAPVAPDFRDRLSHTLEVYQIATSIARRFNLNLPLVEAICLAHDLGHPPFGHAGEVALDKLLLQWGGFHHAAQSVRMVDYLAYDKECWATEETTGLNLTYTVREGIIQHGWFSGKEHTYYHVSEGMDNLAFSQYGVLEAQAVRIADEIAYLNHDIEDLLAYGFDKLLRPVRIQQFVVEVEQDTGEPLTNDVKMLFKRLLESGPGERVKAQIRDLYEASRARVLSGIHPAVVQHQPVIEYSSNMRTVRNLFYKFFEMHIYSDVRIKARNEIAAQYIGEIYDFFLRLFEANPDVLPYHVSSPNSANRFQRYLVSLGSNTVYTDRCTEAGITPVAELEEGLRDEKWKFSVAAADLISYLTDQEAIEVVEELRRPESGKGLRVIELVLSAFPDAERKDEYLTRHNQLRLRDALTGMLS